MLISPHLEKIFSNDIGMQEHRKMSPILLSEPIYTLTDYGARVAVGIVDLKSPWPQDLNDDEKLALRRLQKDKYTIARHVHNQAFESLVAKEIVAKETAVDTDAATLKRRLTRRYLTSPVRFVDLLMLEITTRCNLNCHFCFKGRLPRITDQRIHDLTRAIEDAKQMGIGQFLFNGGELTIYGDKWLDLVRLIAATGHVAGVISNGWWGIHEPFSIMGHRFDNAAGFAAALRSAGISEIMFSLDGPREIHDTYRRCSGLYDRVICAVAAAKAAGIRCDVSIVLRDGLHKNDRFFQDVMKIFELADDPRSMAKKGKKTIKTGVLLESEYDFGNASKSIAERNSAPYSIDQQEQFQGICKGITHGMKLSIRANGEVEPCTIGTMGKGYGNIHDEPLSTIVNKMRASPVYRMFEKNTFVDYRPYFSRDLFGSRFFHPCTFFGIIASLAAGVEQLRAKDELNRENVDALNLQIAQEMGFV